MKTICFLAVLVVAFNYANAKCEPWSATDFDCAGKGKLEMQESSDGSCKYACVDGNEKRYCEDLYPAPNSPEYDHAFCKGKVPSYECIHDTEPRWVQYGDNSEKCAFHCQRSDMLFGCEQLHPIRYDE